MQQTAIQFIPKTEPLGTQVLVVGGGVGGTAAALQAARRGARTVLVGEFPCLGGMLTAAGVSAPDGNELAAFQTGLWGAFLRELQQRQPQDFDRAWVSFFTFDPRIGAEIFADWVQALPNLTWIWGQVPREVYRTGDRITGVRFDDYRINADIVLDGTELGDVLALGEIPHRWGWDWQTAWNEPSAPTSPNELSDRYPVQALTWVVLLRDFGKDAIAPEIPPPPTDKPDRFTGALEGYTPQKFLSYGRLSEDLYMLNWPTQGNDYGEGLDRLVGSAAQRKQLLQEACWHSQSFARFVQTQVGRRYGLAEGVFPHSNAGDTFATVPSAFALHPYYRESRRLVGIETVREQDILPVCGGKTASLNLNSIAIGNYMNDRHYPGYHLPLKPKSTRWGGRTTGTPFTLPYGCLVPASIDGLLVCEKNISVSHIANGATRLQPVVMNVGQAAGMAAALCVELGTQPRDLPVERLQQALLEEPTAPAALVPLFDSLPEHKDWLHWQRYFSIDPEKYPNSGEIDRDLPRTGDRIATTHFCGIFQRNGWQDYTLKLLGNQGGRTWQLVTLQPDIDKQLQTYISGTAIAGWGWFNEAGNWLRVDGIGG
ncbi:FAD-dependent oxidoreductase [Oscillatoriales cyanobacterium LEGE 11467]|uniref:FAD-dependent oxidoreductase n=1 Tax=Zarconia navalis LEGE 11467 TaxID=1828826 RepID=A0A928Z912_9CYAN|nr:FAD-dependent oxidoreductase [Zarconia navalis]MBE9042115.1 FAD-dependent oxidoreductase [Zarconia navalis LEGE 11467]